MPDEPTASEIQLKLRQLLGQATLLCARGHHQQALALAQQALALDDQNWEAHELLGDIQLALDHPQQARQSYHRARELNRDRPALEEKIGRAALAQAEKDRSTELSRSLLAGKAPAEDIKRNPSYAALFSLIIPGLGQVYNREVAKGLVLFAIYLVLLGLSAVAIRAEIAAGPTGPMGSLYRAQPDPDAFLHAAFSGPAAIWVIALILTWIYSIADAAIRASRTMTSDDTGVV